MAYSEEIKESAFKIFAITGSYEETAIRMRQKYSDICPKLRRQTVADWASHRDWHERVERIKEEIRRETDGQVISERIKIVGELKNLRSKLIRQLQADKLKAKSLEGGINALINIIKMTLDLTGEHPRKMRSVNVEKIIMVIFETFAEDQKLGAILDQRQDILLHRIREKLAEREN